MSFRLVAYVTNPSMRTRRFLRDVFGESYAPSAFPVEGPSFDDQRTAIEVKGTIDEMAYWASDDVVLVQPEDVAPISLEEAFALVRSHQEWGDYIARAKMAPRCDVRVDAARCKRCTAFAAYDARQGLQPGIGFLVDHHTRRVFSRTINDLGPLVSQSKARSWTAEQVLAD